jgi:hypothetical protein
MLGCKNKANENVGTNSETVNTEKKNDGWPTDDQIIELVKSDPESVVHKEIENRMTRRPGWDIYHDAVINNVTILEHGIYNKDEKYYPVKITTNGTVNRTSTDVVPFNDIDMVLKLAIDDFGKWKVMVSNPIL